MSSCGGYPPREATRSSRFPDIANSTWGPCRPSSGKRAGLFRRTSFARSSTPTRPKPSASRKYPSIGTTLLLKRSQDGSDFNPNRLAALCRACHEQTGAAYARGRLVGTLLGVGRFSFALLRGAGRYRSHVYNGPCTGPGAPGGSPATLEGLRLAADPVGRRLILVPGLPLAFVDDRSDTES